MAKHWQILLSKELKNKLNAALLAEKEVSAIQTQSELIDQIILEHILTKGNPKKTVLSAAIKYEPCESVRKYIQYFPNRAAFIRKVLGDFLE